VMIILLLLLLLRIIIIIIIKHLKSYSVLFYISYWS
jgi:hypothetical protein